MNVSVCRPTLCFATAALLIGAVFGLAVAWMYAHSHLEAHDRSFPALV